MGHCYYHALSSACRFGGVAEDYVALHNWFDESKAITADFRHRALRHHAEGIFMLERFFGTVITVSTGREVPVRQIGEQHVIEDLGFIPSFADWVRCIRPEPWMQRAQPIHRIVDPFAAHPDKGDTPVARRQADGGARSIADPTGSRDDASVADAAFAHSP